MNVLAIMDSLFAPELSLPLKILGIEHLLLGIVGLAAYLLFLQFGEFSHGSYAAVPDPIFMVGVPVLCVLATLLGVGILRHYFWFGLLPISVILLAVTVFFLRGLYDNGNWLNAVSMVEMKIIGAWASYLIPTWGLCIWSYFKY